MDNQFYMILTYHHMILDESVVITELEEEPIYMDVVDVAAES